MANDAQLKVVVDLVDKMSGDLKKIKGNIGDLDKQTTSTTTKLSNRFTSFGNSVTSALSNISKRMLQFGAVAIPALGAGILKIAGDFEQSRIAFETMLGSAEKGQRVLNELIDFAAKTPFTLQGVQSSAKQLLAMGINTKKLIPILKSLGDVSAGLSVPVQQLAVAYGQVRAANQLYGTELRQFVQAGVPLLGQLAENFGKTKAEVKKMVEEGKVGFADVERAFQDLSSKGGKFHNLMERQSKTLQGSLSNLRDILSKTADKFGRQFLPEITSAVQDLTKWLEENEETIEDVAIKMKAWVAVTKDIIGAFKRLYEMIQVVNNITKKFFNTFVVPGIWDAFKNKINNSTKSLSDYYKEAKAASERTKELNRLIARGNSKFGPFRSEIIKTEKPLADFGGSANETANKLKNAFKKMARDAETLNRDITSAISKAEEKILGIQKKMTELRVGKIEETKNARMKFAQEIVNSQKRVKNLEKQIAQETEISKRTELQNTLNKELKILEQTKTAQIALRKEITRVREQERKTDLEKAKDAFQDRVRMISQEFEKRMSTLQKELQAETNKHAQLLRIRKLAIEQSKSFLLDEETATLDSVNKQISAYNKLAQAVQNSKRGITTGTVSLGATQTRQQQAITNIERLTRLPAPNINVTVNGDVSGEDLIVKVGDALVKNLQQSVAIAG